MNIYSGAFKGFRGVSESKGHVGDYERRKAEVPGGADERGHNYIYIIDL